MTGWGQEGPLAHAAGHDINYIALAGALEPIGRRGQKPPPPLNLVGDFGGGGMLLAFGVRARWSSARARARARSSTRRWSTAPRSLMTMFYGMRHAGVWSDERGTNLLDTGAHFYDMYETADGKYVSIGAIEPQFYAELLEKLGLAGEELPRQMDRAQWPAMKQRLEKIFKTKTRDEWCEIMEGSDACFAPVLAMSEAPEHPHNARAPDIHRVAGTMQPAPAPRFSRTPPAIARPPAHAGRAHRRGARRLGLRRGRDRRAAHFGAAR